MYWIYSYRTNSILKSTEGDIYFDDFITASQYRDSHRTWSLIVHDSIILNEYLSMKLFNKLMK